MKIPLEFGAPHFMGSDPGETKEKNGFMRQAKKTKVIHVNTENSNPFAAWWLCVNPAVMGCGYPR